MNPQMSIVPVTTQGLTPVEPARSTVAIQPYVAHPQFAYVMAHPQPPQPAAPADETLISVEDIVRWLHTYWKRGILTALPIAALIFYFLGFGKKVYQAGAMLQVHIQDESLLKLPGSASSFSELSGPQIINNHRTGLKTRRYVDYLFRQIPAGEMSEMLGPIGQIGWKSRLLVAAGIKDPPRAMTPEEAFNKFTNEAVRVEPIKESHVLRIIVEGGNPQLVASLANHYAQDYIQYVASDAVDNARGDLQQLTNKAADTKKLLDDAERELASFNQQSDLLRTGDANDLSTMRADSLEKALSDVEVELLRADERVRQVQDTIQNGGDLGSFKGQADGTKVVELQKQLVEAKSRRDKLLEYCGSRHPTLITTISEIARMEKEISSTVASAAGSEQVRLRSERDRLTQALAAARGEAFGQSTARIRQKQLRDSVESLRKLYADLLQNQERARFASETQSNGSLSVKDVAVPPDEPISPRKSIALIVSIFAFGLLTAGVPVASGAFHELVLPTVRRGGRKTGAAPAAAPAPVYPAPSPFQVAPPPATPAPAAHLPYPAPAPIPPHSHPMAAPAIIAAVPELMAGEGPVQLSELLHPNPLSGGNSMSQITGLLERFRGARRGTGIVLITSAATGEGKSMIASALSAALCSGGRSVFLIECNPTSPGIENWFPHAQACSSWSSDLETLRYGCSNLFMLPAIDLPSYEMHDLIDGYRAWVARAQAQGVDWVILDGASLLNGFADVAQVAPMATDIVFVHDPTRCDSDRVKAGLNLLKPLVVQDNLRGIVLNRQTTCPA